MGLLARPDHVHAAQQGGHAHPDVDLDSRLVAGAFQGVLAVDGKNIRVKCISELR